MAEQPSAHDGGVVVRGALAIADRVVSRVAGHAAAQAPGVVSTSSRALPRVRRTGDRVEIDVELAVAWPVASADVARGVQERVRTAVAFTTGLDVTGVRVVVADIVAPADQRRVR